MNSLVPFTSKDLMITQLISGNSAVIIYEDLFIEVIPSDFYYMLNEIQNTISFINKVLDAHPLVIYFIKKIKEKISLRVSSVSKDINIVKFLTQYDRFVFPQIMVEPFLNIIRIRWTLYPRFIFNLRTDKEEKIAYYGFFFSDNRKLKYKEHSIETPKDVDLAINNIMLYGGLLAMNMIENKEV